MRTRFFSFLTMLTAAGAIMAGTPKYIFYYIGDGMGMGQVMATEAYNRTVLGNYSADIPRKALGDKSQPTKMIMICR